MNKFLAIFALLMLIATTAMAADKQITIAASSEVATGLFIGAGLIGIVLFAVVMLMDVQSGSIGDSKKEQ